MVDDVLLVHDVNNKVVEYTLRAAVEQLGNEEGGHYVTHLVNKGKVVTIDDKLFKGSYISEGSLADLELCQLFFFTNLAFFIIFDLSLKIQKMLYLVILVVNVLYLVFWLFKVARYGLKHLKATYHWQET